MSARTAAQRGDLVEEMLVIAAYLSTVVHGDGGARDVAQALARLDAAQQTALIVVLAGLADPDRPLGALLGWLDFDEHAQPIAPAVDERTTLRQIAEDYPIRTAPPEIDEVAVVLALEGQDVPLTPKERVVAVAEGRRRGMSMEAIAAALRGDQRNLARAWERAKRRARQADRPDPALPDAFGVAA